MRQTFLLNDIASKKGFFLDPRTKLLLLVTISTVSTSSSDNISLSIFRYILVAVPFLGLVLIKRIKNAIVYLVFFVASNFTALFLLPYIHGFFNFLVMAICVVFSRMMPGFAMGWYFIVSTNVSEFISALEKMHVSEKIIIPLAVVFRFFPTVGEEYSSIKDAMKMRGVRLGGGKMSDMLEYRIIPLIISCVKIGEELSAAALTRGLGNPAKRTSLCNVKLNFIDIIIIMFCTFSFSAMLF